MDKQTKIEKIYEIIWETNHWNEIEWDKFVWIMIWDVLDWIYSDKYEHNKEKCKIHDFKWEYEDFFWWLWVEVMILAGRRWYKRKPIEDQSEVVIDFIYWLIE